MTGITDPAEEYFKDGIWGWASSTWEKLLSAGGRLFTASHGYDGSAWRKLALVWGYSARYAEYESGVASGAGAGTLTFSTCPSGVARVILGCAAYNNNASSSWIGIRLQVGATSHFQTIQISPVQYQTVELRQPVVLVNPDALYVDFTGAGASSGIRASAWGYDMELTN